MHLHKTTKDPGFLLLGLCYSSGNSVSSCALTLSHILVLWYNTYMWGLWSANVVCLVFIQSLVHCPNCHYTGVVLLTDVCPVSLFLSGVYKHCGVVLSGLWYVMCDLNLWLDVPTAQPHTVSLACGRDSLICPGLTIRVWSSSTANY